MIIDGHQHIADDYAPILARMDALGVARTVLIGIGVRDLDVVTIRDSAIFRSHFLLKTLGMRKAKRLVRSRALREALLGDPRNDAVLRAVQERPDRFSGFAFVNPESPRALDEARRCLDGGLCGIKLALVQYPTDLNGPRMSALCELARERRVPVFIHIGLTRESSDLSDVVRRFRDVVFIIAHTGVQRFDEVAGLARACNNVYVDTSSYISTEAKIRRLCRVVGPGKLVMGSDVPVMCADVADAMRKIETQDVSGAEKERMLGGNLDAILREARA